MMLNSEETARLLELADAVGVNLFIRIAQAVCRARQKHQSFADDFSDGLAAVESEFYEFKSQAMLAQRRDGTLRPERVAKAEAELVDLIATGIRMLDREYKNAPVNVTVNISAVNNFSSGMGEIVNGLHRGGIVVRKTPAMGTTESLHAKFGKGEL